MDIAWQYLWAAGYDLPPTPLSIPAIKLAEPAKRRGKKAAWVKRQRAGK